MTIKIFGDSHVGALRRGWKQLQASGSVSPELEVEFYASDGRYWLECDINETATNFQISQRRQGGETLDDHVVSKNGDIYFFSSPLHSAPLYRNRVWRTCCPWVCAAAHNDLQALSSRVIESWAESQVSHRIKMIEKLRAGGVLLSVVEPPKPLKRTPKIYGIQPDVLIAANDIYRNHVSALLAGKGVPIIRVPDESYESSGFTKSIYAPKDMKDPHHGNDLLGALVMNRILESAN